MCNTVAQVTINYMKRKKNANANYSKSQFYLLHLVYYRKKNGRSFLVNHPVQLSAYNRYTNQRFVRHEKYK